MEDKSIKYFNYVSADFLIDRNGIPVFMEVNDNTLAPYYIEQKNLIAQKALLGSNRLINHNTNHKSTLLSCFDRCFEGIPENFIKNGKKIAIICRWKKQSIAIEKEIQYLIQLFRQHGYDAEMNVPEDFEVKERRLVNKKDNTSPSIIFRRNFSFPPINIEQPVINDLRVRKIAGNKYLTHKIVEELIESHKVNIRQPRTYLVKNKNSLVDAIDKIFHDEIDCVAKPNGSYGGDGFFCFQNCGGIKNSAVQEKISIISQRMENGEEYLIQEKIESSLFRSGDNKDYCFDVRFMVYGGKFAGVEGRRSNYPFSREKAGEKSLVTNITNGGIDLVVLSTMDEHCLYETRQLISDEGMRDPDFKIDSNFLILGNQLFSKMKQAAEAIVKVIDETIITSEG